MYSNSTSSLSCSFCIPSNFYSSQSTTLRSKIQGTKPFTASSQVVFPRHAPSISPPGCTVICLSFRHDELLSAATLSFSFLLWSRVALVVLSVFPVLCWYIYPLEPQDVHSEANKAPDMAWTPVRWASSTALAMAWTPLSKASSMVPGLLAVARDASKANLDTIL
jgi:hypothetical protein